MKPVFEPEIPRLRMRCPSCGFGLGDLPSPEAKTMECSQCSYRMPWDGDCWDALIDQAYPRNFARQWVLWEAGKLGDPNLVYGNDPKKYFREVLAATSLSEEELKSMQILEIGFGHGRLLHQLQECSPAAYGIDLSKPLKSAQLRPGSAFFGNLLNMPFVPGQFDLVVCRGVIHHTPDPKESFACAAKQVADNGVLYLGGHYEPAMKLSFLLRRIFPGSWHYPEPVRLGLSSGLSVVRSTMEALRTRSFAAREFQRSYAHFKLNMFDILAPRWASEHPEDEVTEWFASQGMMAQRLGPGEYVGAKGHSADETGTGAPQRFSASIPSGRTV
jgi:SAM-dependent methyltransferase